MKQNKPKETCSSGSIIFPDKPFYGDDGIILSERMRDEYSYIHEHLMTLYFVAKEFKCRNIVEIGTGKGESTLALAKAASRINGHVHTIDIDDCVKAKALIRQAELDQYVTFIRANSDTLNWDGKIDLLLIDGNHESEAVLSDIYKFAHYNVISGGFMINHDICNPKWGKGIQEALQTYIMNTQNKWSRYEWFNCNGLAVWRRD